MTDILQLFHKKQMERIKKEIKEITFVSFVNVKDKNYLQVKSNKTKEEFNFLVEGNLFDVGEDDYDSVINRLKIHFDYE